MLDSLTGSTRQFINTHNLFAWLMNIMAGILFGVLYATNSFSVPWIIVLVVVFLTGFGFTAWVSFKVEKIYHSTKSQSLLQYDQTIVQDQVHEVR